MPELLAVESRRESEMHTNYKLSVLTIRITLVLIAPLLCVGEIYVSPSGSADAAGDFNDPVNSIQEAIDRGADEIVLLPGVHAAKGNGNIQIVSKVLRSYLGPVVTIIQGEQGSRFSTGGDCVVDGIQFVGFSDFVEDCPDPPFAIGGRTIFAHCYFNNNIYSGHWGSRNRGGYCFDGSDQNIIALFRIREGSLTFYRSLISQNEVQDALIHAFSINLKSINIINSLVYNNTLDGVSRINGLYGFENIDGFTEGYVSELGSGQYVTVVNSILHQNWARANIGNQFLKLPSNGRVYSSCGQLYPKANTEMGDDNLVDVDPQLVWTGTRYELAPTSPCIDAGTDPELEQYWFYDYLKEHHPEDLNPLVWDIGHHEYGDNETNYFSGKVQTVEQNLVPPPSPPQVTVLSVSNRAFGNILDVDYTVTDGDSSNVAVYAFLWSNQNSPLLENTYVMSNLVEGTDSNVGAGIAADGTTNRLTWDYSNDTDGAAVLNGRVLVVANDTNSLPMGFHFIHVPASTNLGTYAINKYEGAGTKEQLELALLWALAEGRMTRSTNGYLAVGGTYDSQVVVSNATLTITGRSWMAENIDGVRLATQAEIDRAKQADAYGVVVGRKNTSSHQARQGRFFNDWGIETTTTDAWFFVKE